MTYFFALSNKKDSYTAPFYHRKGKPLAHKRYTFSVKVSKT